MADEPLSEQETETRLARLPGWSVAEGDLLTRTYTFSGHLPAVAMVVHVSAIQEELNHHAEQTLGYNTLTLAVNTHSAGGRITELDFTLAGRVEAVAQGHGAK
ncbi:putative pterin-4-alpha-carbinolamine dehydratase [Streptomyces sp. RB5]|uniref:Putative pterin-4-alpha-carbinolamine dehydratase n=1 Tax=Streptomyces smaragdinus TaxID=2585196 RepID=A0A7K0CGC9_9ACTN|nr:4a-hydroxytetrahydrobiopterin dehydratase [Streptomyces smaragdinus]MQY12527.1 putative pterin-4-alpha-carbinolamine dehydratase [Streptomyces smaragdinus]